MSQDTHSAGSTHFFLTTLSSGRHQRAPPSATLVALLWFWSPKGTEPLSSNMEGHDPGAWQDECVPRTNTSQEREREPVTVATQNDQTRPGTRATSQWAWDAEVTWMCFLYPYHSHWNGQKKKCVPCAPLHVYMADTVFTEPPTMRVHSLHIYRAAL